MPPGFTYEKLYAYFSIAGTAATRTEMAAQILQVRLVISGVELWIGSAAQLLSIASYYAGVDFSTPYPGYLPLDFLMGWTHDLADGMKASLGTADQNSVQLEWTFAGNATIDGASMFCAQAPLPENTGVARRLQRVQPTIAATGFYDFGQLPQPRAGESLIALHMFPPVVANLAYVIYEADSVQLFKGPRSLMNLAAATAGFKRAPQDANGMFSLDFTALRGTTDDAVDMSKVNGHVLRLNFANAAPNTFPILVEMAANVASANQVKA